MVATDRAEGPTLQEVAKAAEMRIEDVCRVMKMAVQVDRKLVEEPRQMELAGKIQQAFEKLPYRAREILKLRYGWNWLHVHPRRSGSNLQDRAGRGASY